MNSLPQELLEVVLFGLKNTADFLNFLLSKKSLFVKFQKEFIESSQDYSCAVFGFERKNNRFVGKPSDISSILMESSSRTEKESN